MLSMDEDINKYIIQPNSECVFTVIFSSSFIFLSFLSLKSNVIALHFTVQNTKVVSLTMTSDKL